MVLVTYRTICQEYRVGVKIPWPSYLDPLPDLLDGDVPRSTSYGVYISQLIRFAIVSSHVADFNARNKSLAAKLLQQGYRYHKLRKTFSKVYRRHYALVSKFKVGLKITFASRPIGTGILW